MIIPWDYAPLLGTVDILLKWIFRTLHAESLGVGIEPVAIRVMVSA